MQKPSFCTVLRHALRGFHFKGLPLSTTIGLLLVAINVPVGWGGAAICAYFSVRSKSAAWGTASAAIYALSWGMLFLGILLAGKDTVRSFQQHLPRAWKAWRRARRRP